MMNAYGYVRVSTSPQIKSLDDQIELFTDYCHNNNLIIENIITEVGSAFYQEQKKLINLIKNNMNIFIIFKNVSRFSRNINQAIIMFNIIRQNNIRLHFIEENLTFNNDHHNMNKIYLLIRKHQIEVENKINRINRMKQNNWDFRTGRFGRKVIYQNKIRKVVDNTREVNIINLIKALKSETNADIINHYLYQVVPQSCQPIELINSDGEKVKNLKVNKLDYNTIASLLNSYNIKFRGKKWNIFSINMVLKNY